jgi:hypothetical protein
MLRPKNVAVYKHGRTTVLVETLKAHYRAFYKHTGMTCRLWLGTESLKQTSRSAEGDLK